jgi:TatD DNase family protein
MHLIDTHAHIYLDDFSEDQELVMRRATEAGIQTILLPNIDLHSIKQMDNLVVKYPNRVLPMMGLHPCSVAVDFENQLHQMKSELDANPQKFVAIGEIGLDLYWDATTLEIQKEALGIQLGWANQLQLPFVIHCREAYAELFDVFEQVLKPGMRGVLHCFSGTLEDAKRALEWNLFLGIGGVVTYKKSTLPDILKQVPLSQIVLETDAPYLSPVPFRGKRNEPAFMKETALKLSEIYECSLEAIAKQTTTNAQLLFKL